jgi:hypothetical protein
MFESGTSFIFEGALRHWFGIHESFGNASSLKNLVE